jgi:hypothetical protein
MPVWTVHAPPSPGLSDEPADDIVLVREGFSWEALIFGPIWALINRLWLTVALWIVVMIVISLIGLRFGEAVTWPLEIGFLLWFGFEARDFQRARLARRDWRVVGIVDARNSKMAERRYFEKLAAERAANSFDSASSPVTIAPQRQTGFPPVIGFLQGERP